jgi:hypothetical protein
MRRRVLVGAAVAALVLAGACSSAADRANENLSKAAENFEVPRRIVGFCSYETDGASVAGTVDAICKNPDGSISRTSMALSDNVTFVVTQMGGVDVDLFRPRIIFRPENIIPDFDLSTSRG